MTQEHHGQKIKCDCCGSETLAEIRDDKIVIIDKRHGRRHIAILKVADLMAIMQKPPVTPA
jgi:hypothetical protein